MPRITIVAAAVAVLPLALLLSRVEPGPLADRAPPAPQPPGADPPSPSPSPTATPSEVPLAAEATPTPEGAPAAEATPSGVPVTVIEFAPEPLVDAPAAPRPRPARRSPAGRGRGAARPPLHAVVDADGDGLVGAVNLNTASVAELTLLPGMGPKRAQALVQYRERRRLTHSRQVTRVRGIGPGTYRRWRTHIKVRGENTLRRLRKPGGRRRQARS